MLLTRLDVELNWVVTSWLWSPETSNLRAASTECRDLFARNVPAPTRGLFYRESLEPPKVYRVEARPPSNPHSPLRCWPVRFERVRALLPIPGWSPSCRPRDLAVIAEDGFALSCADESFKRHGTIALAAIAQPDWTHYFKHHRHVALAAVTINGSALKYTDESLKRDRDVVLAAVTQDGYALQYAEENLKSDRDVVLAAVKKNAPALKYADESLKRDRDIVIAAVKKHVYAFKYADASFRRDRGVILVAVEHHFNALLSADEIFRRDNDFVLAIQRVMLEQRRRHIDGRPKVVT